MNKQLTIDLRKTEPLGPDFTKTYRRARLALDTWLRMGEPDTKKPGYTEHKAERERLAHVVCDFVTVARLLAKAVGPKAMEVSGLRWAVCWQGMDRPLLVCLSADETRATYDRVMTDFTY